MKLFALILYEKVAELCVYAAEEFAYMRRVTTKVDVFSFGIVMMEFFTRRRPTGSAMEVDGVPLTLRQFVEKSLEGGVDGVLSIADREMDLPSEVETGKVAGVLELALACTRFNAEERPDMNEVLSNLVRLSIV